MQANNCPPGNVQVFLPILKQGKPMPKLSPEEVEFLEKTEANITEMLTGFVRFGYPYATRRLCSVWDVVLDVLNEHHRAVDLEKKFPPITRTTEPKPPVTTTADFPPIADVDDEDVPF